MHLIHVQPLKQERQQQVWESHVQHMGDHLRSFILYLNVLTVYNLNQLIPYFFVIKHIMTSRLPSIWNMSSSLKCLRLLDAKSTWTNDRHKFWLLVSAMQYIFFGNNCYKYWYPKNSHDLNFFRLWRGENHLIHILDVTTPYFLMTPPQ